MARQWVPIAVLSGIVVVGAAWTVGPFIFEGRDHAIAIDSPEVRRAAGDACTAMQEDVSAATTDAARFDAVDVMLARIRALGPETLAGDRPTEAWLADWDSFLAARRAGDPIPTFGGTPIHRRMDDLVKDLRPCQVPAALLPGRT